MELDQVLKCFANCGYQIQHQTKKIIGFKAPLHRRVAYLRTDTGLPAYVKLVIDPHFDSDPLYALDSVERPKNQFRHGSNMQMLPRRRNGGATDIPFGRAVDLQTLGALEMVLYAYDK